MTSPEHITIPIRGRQLPLIPVVAIVLPVFLFMFGLALGYACQTGTI